MLVCFHPASSFCLLMRLHGFSLSLSTFSQRSIQFFLSSSILLYKRNLKIFPPFFLFHNKIKNNLKSIFYSFFCSLTLFWFGLFFFRQLSCLFLSATCLKLNCASFLPMAVSIIGCEVCLFKATQGKLLFSNSFY